MAKQKKQPFQGNEKIEVSKVITVHCERVTGFIRIEFGRYYVRFEDATGNKYTLVGNDFEDFKAMLNNDGI